MRAQPRSKGLSFCPFPKKDPGYEVGESTAHAYNFKHIFTDSDFLLHFDNNLKQMLLFSD